MQVLRACGIDMTLGEIGAAIQEVMESYEVTYRRQGTNQNYQNYYYH